jgi:hypothetical protein
MNDLESERYFKYDKKELNGIIRAFKAMSEQAQEEAKRESSALAQFAANQIKIAAGSAPNNKVAQRVADGVKVSSTSKIGEFSFGFASQKFSGGATTQFNHGREGGNGLLAGAEFGSKNYPQFAGRSPRYGVRGNQGYFIYPTLRDIQPQIIRKWEESFDAILKEYN